MAQEFDTLLKDAARTFDGLRTSRFRRLEKLGMGGTSVVYRALDRTLDREVAIKFLRSEIQPDPGMAERFQREAKIAAGFDHPNIVRVFDAGEDNGRLYISMEVVEGRPLSGLLGSRAVETPDMLRLLVKAARGVAAAHERGIIHRDLKPANILVTEDGEPKVADFGLALVADRNATRLTRAGTSVGTPSYMSPEQAEGRTSDLSTRTDVYGLGAILYEMLTGRPPHTGETPLEILARISAEDPVAPRRINPRVHPEVEAICMKALERKPRRRYADAGAFADDLANHLASRPVVARPAGPATRALKWARRRPASSLTAAALLVLALGIGVERAVHWARLRSLVAQAETARYPEDRARLWDAALELEPLDPVVRVGGERARKRADAARHAAEADQAEKEHERTDIDLGLLEKSLATLEAAIPPGQTEKPEVWKLRRQAEALRARTADLRARMIGGYARAAGLDPAFEPPRKFLADWFWEKFQEAERSGDSDAAAEALAYVHQYDNGRYGKLLSAPGSLRVATDPPGARAGLWTFEAAPDGRLVPVGPRDLGATPAEVPSLAPGSYLLTLSLKGYPDLRHPVRVRRGTRHVESVKFLRDADIGEGFVYVPGGEQDGPRVVRVAPFLIAKHETTWADFAPYLNGRLGAGAADRMRRMPAASQPRWREEAGRIIVQAGGDLPATGVTWPEASDYCAWRSERDPSARYRLPTSLEWETAARGADGRRFPWGDVFDWSFANGARSRQGAPGPAPVGSFPKDESVYGVRDLAGNAEEWCDGDYDASVGMKHVRGGGWDDLRAEDFEIGDGDGDKPMVLEHDKGFRIVRVYPR